MSAQSILTAIESVAAVLPFDLEDYERVNRMFAVSAVVAVAPGHPDIDVWTYCFVSRYFALKFVRSRRSSSADLDRLIDQVFVRIRRGSTGVRVPARYTSWVNTVCRNAYLTYLRSYKLERLEDPDNIVSESQSSETYDAGLVTDALLGAIDELPAFLQAVARLRFVLGLSYAEINIRTGQPVANLRSYANKALRQLRNNPRLQQIHDDWMLTERP